MSPDDATLHRIIPKKLLLHSLMWQGVIIAPLALFFVLLMMGVLEEPDAERHAMGVGPRLTILFTWLALFSGAAFFSCLGSLVSYSARGGIAAQYVEDGSLALSMHLVGSVFGIVLLLLFLGGFVAGNLFPDLSEVGFYRVYHVLSGVREWAKLFVWAFLAGFSERLMPDLLSNFARRMETSVETR